MQDGKVRIPFFINPTPPLNSGLTADQIEAAILGSVRTWQSGHPAIRFEYQGRTEREPLSGDGFNDFSFGAWAPAKTDSQGHIVEADIYRTAKTGGTGGYVSSPCEQRDNACGNTGGNDLVIEQTTIHEVGHTLGLGDLMEDDTRLLTMDTRGGSSGDRYQQTLGLGDLKGLRALYGPAPYPPIYSP